MASKIVASNKNMMKPVGEVTDESVSGAGDGMAFSFSSSEILSASDQKYAEKLGIETCEVKIQPSDKDTVAQNDFGSIKNFLSKMEFDFANRRKQKRANYLRQFQSPE